MGRLCRHGASAPERTATRASEREIERQLRSDPVMACLTACVTVCLLPPPPTVDESIDGLRPASLPATFAVSTMARLEGAFPARL